MHQLPAPSAINRPWLLTALWPENPPIAARSPADRGLLQQQVKRLKAAVGKSSPSKFELRYAQACVAREVDQDKKDRCQLRRSKASTEALAQRLEMDSEELKCHLEDGRIWNSVCSPYDGLLPFVLLDPNKSFYISKKEWKGVRDEQLEAFHGLLDDDYTENMRRAGRTFQEIMTKGLNQVFPWDEEKLNPKAEGRASLLWRTIGVTEDRRQGMQIE
ncbi:hypothetical protein EDB80DRAFT_899213 [Ilyonectria destructans]|nr:hypothetical protein EDB80DRAFT_899213 [Ilyonectria destructans]